ncbi:beta-1,3-galactosyltransferase 1-like [Asterias rubens]|uniref:beta-1,3-galactosyltransferase 1-like n=1 Tax=Asterias rubens TaxID=7604 RepID=UPI001455202E|nr:beta-1,3-galactosyltransferase 1-like [Asterias rubens]XP_033632089.1 beta-1,3-galactosyltransferase 1-like [Asterias rubens]
MPQLLHFLLLLVGGVVSLVLLFNTSGPVNTLERFQLDGPRLSRSRPVTFTASDVNNTANWTTVYLEHLQKAYETQNKEHVNPHNFKLRLDEPMACVDVESGTPKCVVLLVLISTVHANYGRRQAIRETWGSPKKLAGLHVVTLFLLGNTSNINFEKRIIEESSHYHDLLLEDFTDTYKNLTLKTMMAMKWASTHCPQASFVMKTDDDMYVSYRNILNYIMVSNAPDTNLAFGLVLAGQAPVRDKRSKWYMSEELFSGDVYPPWLSGGGFVLSGDLPARIYAASLDIGYLYLEDVYVGFCLKKLEISLVMNQQFNNMNVPYSYCRYRNIITSHHNAPDLLRTIWADQQRSTPCWFLT